MINDNINSKEFQSYLVIIYYYYYYYYDYHHFYYYYYCYLLLPIITLHILSNQTSMIDCNDENFFKLFRIVSLAMISNRFANFKG